MRTRPPFHQGLRLPWRPAGLGEPYTELLVQILAGKVRLVRDGHLLLHTDSRSEIVTAPVSVLMQLGLAQIGKNGVLELTIEAYDEMFPATGVTR